MICLAFEFTSERRSIAVADGDRVLAETHHAAGRETPVFGMIVSVLGEAGIERKEVRRVAVSVGPGSYTGIRLAIATAQGWHLATGAELVAVDTFEVLRASDSGHEDGDETTYAVDAQRNEFAVRVWSGAAWKAHSRLTGGADVLEWFAGGRRVMGPELGRWFRGLFAKQDASGRLAASVELFPTASALARLARTAGAIPAGQMAPVYLREANFVKAPPARIIPGIDS
jgi:tRNA threonylcarbamoyladenosine biosynthesis protein TsaB